MLNTLVLSYVVIIVLTATIVGAASQVHLISRYEEQREALNETVIDYLESNIYDALGRFHQAYLLLALPSLDNSDLHDLFVQPLAGNHHKIAAVYGYLKRIRNQASAGITAIGVYFSHSNIHLSSSTGFRLVEQYPSIAEHYRSIDDGPSLADRGFFDTATADTILLTYPFPILGDPRLGYITLEVEKSFLLAPIEQSAASLPGYTFVHVPGDNIAFVLSSGAEAPSPVVDGDLLGEIAGSIREYNDRHGRRLVRIGEDDYMVSYERVGNTGVLLCNAAITGEYYRLTRDLRLRLSVILALASACALAAAIIFSRRLYAPLASLLTKTQDQVRRVISEPSLDQERHASNEYELLSRYLDSFAGKIDRLEQTVASNRPLIEHQVIDTLLRDTDLDPAALRERLDLLRFPTHGEVVAIGITVPVPLAQQRSVQHVLALDAINRIRRFAARQGMVVAATTVGDFDILVLLGGEHRRVAGKPATERVGPGRAVIEDLRAFVSETYGMSCVGVCDRIQNDPQAMAQSVKQVIRSLGYAFLLPGVPELDLLALSKRDRSTETMDEELFDSYAKAVRRADVDEVRALLTAFVTTAVQPRYSLAEIRRACHDLVSILSWTARDMGASLDHEAVTTFYAEFSRIRSIEDFASWLSARVEDVAGSVVQPTTRLRSSLVEAAQKYMNDHLDTDLSLQAVATVVKISPQYFSKLFKEETGENYIEFLGRARMERARELLETSSFNVDEIARMTGFNSSGYFIRTFKKRFSLTPKVYRQAFVSKSLLNS